MRMLHLFFVLICYCSVQGQQQSIVQDHPKFLAVQNFIAATLDQYDAKDYARSIEIGPYSFDYFVYDRRIPNYSLKIYSKERPAAAHLDQSLSIESLNYHLGGRLLFATNGGIFDRNFAPTGLLMKDGEVKKALDTSTKGFGNFYLQPNGIFAVLEGNFMSIQTTESFQQLYPNSIYEGSKIPGLDYATQSGPMLVSNGQLNPIFTPGSQNRFLRSGVGIIDEHRAVFIISKFNINFYDFATIFRDIFQCRNALFLDGQISKMLCTTRRLSLSGKGGRFATIIGVARQK